MVAVHLPRKQIEDALRVALSTSTGLTWVRERQVREQPQPAMPFGTYALVGTIALGQDAEVVRENVGGAAGAEVSIDNIGLRRLRLSCNVYSRSDDPNKDPSAFCDSAIAAFNTRDVRETLHDAGITVLDISQVRDLDMLESNQNVLRSQFDVILLTSSVYTTTTTYIETVQVESVDDLWSPNPMTFTVGET